MNKQYYECKLEGKCDKCDRDPIICEEEGYCLSQRTYYELVIVLYKHTITFNDLTKEECKQFAHELENAFITKSPFVKILNYNICTDKILYWKDEVYYG